GLVTPLGVGTRETWEAVTAGRSGVGPVTRFDAAALGSRIAGEVKAFEPERYVPARDARTMDRFIQLGVAAAAMALADAALTVDDALSLRAGCYLGVGLGGT